MIRNLWRIVLLTNCIMPISSKTINTRCKTKRILIALFPGVIGHFANVSHVIEALSCRLPVNENALQACGFILIILPLSFSITDSVVFATIKAKQLLPALAGEHFTILKVEIGNVVPLFWLIVFLLRDLAIAISIRKLKLRRTGWSKWLLFPILCQFFNARIRNILNILQTFWNAKPPHWAESPIVSCAAVLIAIRKIMNANKLAKRVFTFFLARLSMRKRIVIIHLNVETSLAITCVSFETVINVVAAAVYITISIRRRRRNEYPPPKHHCTGKHRSAYTLG